MTVMHVPNINMVPGSDTGVGLILRNIANALPVVKSSNEAVKTGIRNDFFILFLFFLYKVVNNVEGLFLRQRDFSISGKSKRYFRSERFTIL
jgi:hypothetical protein